VAPDFRRLPIESSGPVVLFASARLALVLVSLALVLALTFPSEGELLAMLAAHPGRAYSRRQLLDRVWGHDHEGDPRTVDVHVRWLRSKLEPRPEAPIHIVTVRGVGYRLDPEPR